MCTCQCIFSISAFCIVLFLIRLSVFFFLTIVLLFGLVSGDPSLPSILCLTLSFFCQSLTEPGIHRITQAGFNSCLGFPRAGVTSVHHHM